jgi:hypothetical protein
MGEAFILRKGGGGASFDGVAFVGNTSFQQKGFAITYPFYVKINNDSTITINSLSNWNTNQGSLIAGGSEIGIGASTTAGTFSSTLCSNGTSGTFTSGFFNITPGAVYQYDVPPTQRYLTRVGTLIWADAAGTTVRTDSGITGIVYRTAPTNATKVRLQHAQTNGSVGGNCIGMTTTLRNALTQQYVFSYSKNNVNFTTVNNTSSTLTSNTPVVAFEVIEVIT